MRSGPDAFQLLTALYRLLLGRDPDDVGLRHYADKLLQGADEGRIFAEIAGSEEATRTFLRSPTFTRLGREQWEALAELGQRPQLFFIHIMKTGGTSLCRGLCQFVPSEVRLTDFLLDELVLLPRYVLCGALLVSGHLPFEARDMLRSDAAVCTVLRDPVERTLSHYWHLCQQAEVWQDQPDFSLEVFLTSPRWRSLASNYQARYLVHTVGVADAWVRFSPVERFAGLGTPFPRTHHHPLQSFFDCSPLLFGEQELTELALARLAEIRFVGVTDALDVLFGKLLDHWGIEGAESLARENVASGRPRADDLPPSMVDRIREANQVDLVLYEHSRKLQSVPDWGHHSQTPAH